MNLSRQFSQREKVEFLTNSLILFGRNSHNYHFMRRRCPRPRPRLSRAWARCWLLRLRLRSRPRWCRRWRSRRAVGRVQVCWAVQGEEAPGRGFSRSGLWSFPVLGGFACLSVWFGRMIPCLYEDIQYALSLSLSAGGHGHIRRDPSRCVQTTVPPRLAQDRCDQKPPGHNKLSVHGADARTTARRALRSAPDGTSEISSTLIGLRASGTRALFVSS